jgi:hypothetical protein
MKLAEEFHPPASMSSLLDMKRASLSAGDGGIEKEFLLLINTSSSAEPYPPSKKRL